jgi:alpha-galactosidase
MHFREAIFEANGQRYILRPGQSNSFEAFYADFQRIEMPEGGTRYTIFLHPKQDLSVQNLEIQFDVQMPPTALMFANGYQSWSESRWLPLGAAIPRLRGIARRHMGLYGDEHIAGIPHGSGHLHAWTYTGFRAEAGAATQSFLGSLNERTGFTLFLHELPNQLLRVRKDMAGLQLSHSFPALDVVLLEGGDDAVFERYFALQGITAPQAPRALGWTSWYQHFTNISAALLQENLDGFCAQMADSPALAEPGTALYFQIDDGWQQAVGDWLRVKPDFPQGMGDLARRIREKGLLPGLWLAPFVAAADAEIVRQHPEWLLRDAKGKPLRVGWNPMWGGWYHALDFYHPGVREYLAGVFHMVLEKWGYALVKLDFLFAVCLAPPPGKTRGQVMYEAMEFLRQLVGNQRILGCGVPLGASFGLVDYCRIGGDVHLRWEHRLLAFLRHRERVSTLASLRATLGRWPLNGRAFHSDPDVFVLRDDKQQLSPAQQHTLLLLNCLLGNLLFCSDDMGRYGPEQRCELNDALAWRGSRISAVAELAENLYRIDFEQDGQRYHAFANLSGRRCQAPLALEPYETMVLLSDK